MKLILLLVVVGLGYASFCENESGDSLREIIKPMMINQVEDIFGHCRAFKGLLKKEFKSRRAGECSKYFDELYCFGANKMTEYSDIDLESFELTYSHMSNFISEDGDGRMLAQKSCRYGLPCLDKVVKTMAGCARRDANFWDTAIEKVEEKLSSDLVQNIINEMLASWEDDDPWKIIMETIQTEITSYDDLKAIIDEHIPAADQESMIAGAREGLYNFIEKAKRFCRSGCVDKSADYFEDAFMATHDEDTCPVVNVYGYCGDCQSNMETFVTENDVPCCTQSAVVNIAESVMGTIDRYYDLFKEKEAEIKEAVSDIFSEEEIQTYELVQTLIAEQAACLKETYETLSEEVCVMGA